jgi:hypothetical protein
MYTALLFEVRNCSTNVSASELLNRLPEHWVLLTQNLIQLGRLHARLLQMFIWSASVHRLMLPCIANQKHAVGCVKAMKRLVHLLGTCKARFVDYKEPFMSASGCFVPNEMALERA